MDFAAARKHMVDSQVRVNDVTDRGIQAAMLDIPRERFCAADRAFTAYGEVEPLIAGTRRLMLAREVAKLVQALDAEGVAAVQAPFDRPHGEGYDIIISEGAVESRPDAWIGALKPGGRLGMVERNGRAGRAVLYVKGRQGVSRRELFDAAPDLLDGMARQPAFQL